MGMSDVQIRALAGFQGHNPDDEAKLGKRVMQLALASFDLQKAKERIATLARDLDAALELNRTLEAQRDDIAAEAQTARERARGACCEIGQLTAERDAALLSKAAQSNDLRNVLRERDSARAEEREQCAKVCEQIATFKVEGSVLERAMATVMNKAASDCAASIRSRKGEA
jgi:hypothetical protein